LLIWSFGIYPKKRGATIEKELRKEKCLQLQVSAYGGNVYVMRRWPLSGHTSGHRVATPREGIPYF